MNNKQEASNESMTGLLIFYGIVAGCAAVGGIMLAIQKYKENRNPSMKCERLIRTFSGLDYREWPITADGQTYTPDSNWNCVVGSMHSFKEVMFGFDKGIKMFEAFAQVNPSNTSSDILKFEKSLISLFGRDAQLEGETLRTYYWENTRPHDVRWPNDDWFKSPKIHNRYGNTYIATKVEADNKLVKALSVIKTKIAQVESMSNPTGDHLAYLKIANALLNWLSMPDRFYQITCDLQEHCYVNMTSTGSESLRMASLREATIAIEKIELVKAHVGEFGITAENKALFAESFEKVGYPFTKEGIAQALRDAQTKLDKLRLC